MLFILLLLLTHSADDAREIQITTLSGEAVYLQVQSSETVRDVQRRLGDEFAMSRMLLGVDFLSPHTTMYDIDESTPLTLVRYNLESEVTTLWNESLDLFDQFQSILPRRRRKHQLIHFISEIGRYENEELNIQRIDVSFLPRFESKEMIQKMERMKSHCSKASFAAHVLEEALTYEKWLGAKNKRQQPNCYGSTYVLPITCVTCIPVSLMTGKFFVASAVAGVFSIVLDCGECIYWGKRRDNLLQVRNDLEQRRDDFLQSQDFVPTQQTMIDN